MHSKIKTQFFVECKYHLLPTLIASLIMIGIAGFIFGIGSVDSDSQAIVMERFLPLAGVFSLVTLFYPEFPASIKDILTMKSTSITFIYMMRVLVRCIIYGGMSGLYIYLLVGPSSVTEFMYLWFHSLSIGLFVGNLGLLLFSLTHNLSLAFLISIAFILAQWFISKDSQMFFTLFTMPDITRMRIFIVLGMSFILFVLSIVRWKRKPIG